jgi:hypothetical protein
MGCLVILFRQQRRKRLSAGPYFADKPADVLAKQMLKSNMAPPP